MANSSATKLNPAIQPFFPSQPPSSDSETDGSQRLLGSPVSMEQSTGQSSDEEHRQSQRPGVIALNDNGLRYVATPPTGLVHHTTFQDYKIGAPGVQDALKSDTESSNRSNSPGGWNVASAPSISSSFFNDGTPRIKDLDDVQSFSAGVQDDGRSSPGASRNSVGRMQGQIEFGGAPQLANAFLQAPNRNNSLSVGFGRASFRNSGTEQSFLPSPIDSKENSIASSVDRSSDGHDEISPLNQNASVAFASLGRNFSLPPSSISSASPRSFSHSHEQNASTTRGTTPFSQPYDEHMLSGTGGILGGTHSNGNKISFQASNVGSGVTTDRNSLSRASSRSMSMNSNNQVYDRPPSSFDVFPHGPSDGFDAQAKASPFINDLLDRLLRCEYSTKEIQRELGDVTRKLNWLIERSNTAGQSPQTPAGTADDVRTLTQRVNTLTTSVGQLLALQTQAHMQNISGPSSATGATPNGSNNPMTALNAIPSNPLPAINGSGMHSNVSAAGSGAGLGALGSNASAALNNLNNIHTNVSHHGASGAGAPSSNPLHVLPSRPDVGLGIAPNQRTASIRGANGGTGPLGGPIQRTWSVGNAEMMPRRDSDASILSGGPGINGMNALIRDKRKMSLNISRRESTASTVGEDNGFNSGRERENGAVVSKWEHLPLVPELLRSINKYGIGPPNKIQQRALPFLLRGSDIIAQAPPTQERIAAYIIPAIHVALTNLAGRPSNRGPIVVIISTTVDQATQAQRMIRDLGGPIGIRSALGVGTGGDVIQELRLLQQSMPHILCGTPQKLHALFTSPGGLPGGEVRFLVLDEVDQLIARNLHEFVFNIVKLFPSPRSKTSTLSATSTAATTPAVGTPGSSFNPFEMNAPSSPHGPSRRFSLAIGSADTPAASSVNGPTLPAHSQGLPPPPTNPERQTALFSNTVPQDVLNLANAIQLREPVRVLVRRDGNVTQADTSNGARGLRQFYLYLAFTAGARPATDSANRSDPGAGIIGSGRGATSAETAQAREWKLDALADLFDDIEISHAVVHVGGLNALESVVYKLVSRGFEAVPLHSDMNAGAKLAALNKFRGTNAPMGRPPITRVLVTYDAQVKAPEVQQVPLVINYDLPKAVEEYAHRVAPAVSSSYLRAGVVINFVTATGGDVEMLRSIECFYKIKCVRILTGAHPSHVMTDECSFFALA